MSIGYFVGVLILLILTEIINTRKITQRTIIYNIILSLWWTLSFTIFITNIFIFIICGGAGAFILYKIEEYIPQKFNEKRK